MNNEQKLVADWMQKFGQETPDAPCIPDVGIRILRAKLILEETMEVVEALGFSVYGGCDGQLITKYNLSLLNTGKPNLEAIADGCADLRVVTIGTEIACGIDGEQTFKEVMRSNDSKLWTEAEVVSIKNVVIEQTAFYHTGEHNRRFLVKDKDGKVIKSPSYSPANLQPLINPQTTN